VPGQDRALQLGLPRRVGQVSGQPGTVGQLRGERRDRVLGADQVIAGHQQVRGPLRCVEAFCGGVQQGQHAPGLPGLFDAGRWRP